MLLVTVLRIDYGYRLVAATSWSAPYYRWSLYRNGVLIGPAHWSTCLENVVCFELRRPLAPGPYQLCVECFAQAGFGHMTMDDLDSSTWILSITE